MTDGVGIGGGKTILFPVGCPQVAHLSFANELLHEFDDIFGQDARVVARSAAREVLALVAADPQWWLKAVFSS